MEDFETWRSERPQAPTFTSQKWLPVWDDWTSIDEIQSLALLDYSQKTLAAIALNEGNFEVPIFSRGKGKSATTVRIRTYFDKGDHSVVFVKRKLSILASCSCARWERKRSCDHFAAATAVLWHVFHPDAELSESVQPVARQKLHEAQQLAAQAGVTPDFANSSMKLTGLLYKLCNPKSIWNDRVTPLPLPETLPGFQVPPIKAFLNHFAIAGLNEEQVPDLLRPKNSNDRWDYWSSCYESSAIGNRVQYLFGDTVVRSDEILYFRSTKNVPRELLPIGVAPLERLYENCSLGTDVWRDWYTTDPANTEQVRILFESAKQQIPVYLTFSKEVSPSCQAIRLQKLGVMTEADVVWEVNLTSSADSELKGCANLRLRRKDDQKGEWFSNAWLDRSSGALFFHPLQRKFRSLRLMAGYETNKVLEEGISITGHDRITEQLDALKSFGSEIQIAAPVRKVEASSLVPRIWIHDDGRFSFSIACESLVLWNSSNALHSLSDLLVNGIRALGNAEATELAHRSNRKKRDWDLKALKHAGIAHLLFHETTQFLAQKPLLNGTVATSRPQLLEHLDDVLGEVLLKGHESFEGEKVSQLCSRNVTALMKAAVSLICDMHSDLQTIYLNNERVVVEGVHDVGLKIISALQAYCLSQAGPVLFTKSKNSFFDELFSVSKSKLFCTKQVSDSCSPEADRLQVDDSTEVVLAAFLPLLSEGFEIVHRGQRLEHLDASDLSMQLIIDEQEESGLGTKKVDWFELHPRFFFKGVEISEEQARSLSDTGVLFFKGKYYRLTDRKLPAVKRLEYFWRILRGKNNGQKRAGEKEIYQLPYHRTLEMLALRASGADVQGGPRWQAISRFYDELGTERKGLSMPGGLDGILKPYQQSGVQWISDLYSLGLGGILADDMGLGKTLQTLAMLKLLFDQKEMGHVLVVVPTSLTYNWVSESQRFTPVLPIKIFKPKPISEIDQFLQKNPNGVLVATYGLLSEHAAFFESQNWNIVVFDEAQNLKNIKALRSTTARKIAANFKLCLTGTPLENNLGEFYSLVDLVLPGALGDRKDFVARFVAPDHIQAEDIAYLKLHTKPLLLRRTKSEILKELPDKIETTLKLPFEDEQRRIYRKVAILWNEKVQESLKLNGKIKSQLAMLTGLLRLRQVCSDPAALPETKYDDLPPKISLLVDTVGEIVKTGESVLIFTQFLETYARVKRELENVSIPHFSICGSTTRAERERVLREFSESDHGAALVMTLKTGGVGLNLIKASYVFHLEPWWNPAVENQASDRTHRLGQKKTVQIYRYIMEGSVEEKIEVLKQRKAARFDALFSDTESDHAVTAGDSMLSQSDFEYLLG